MKQLIWQLRKGFEYAIALISIFTIIFLKFSSALKFYKVVVIYFPLFLIEKDSICTDSAQFLFKL